MGAMAQGVENRVGRFSVIPRVGVTIANLSDNSIYLATENNREVKSKSRAGFSGGLDVEYRATDYLGVSLGAYYARQGARWGDYEMAVQGDAGNNGIKKYTVSVVSCRTVLSRPICFAVFIPKRRRIIQETLSLMREVGYDSAFLFKYSERPGTYAAQHLPDTVSEEEKVRRLQGMIDLQNQHWKKVTSVISAKCSGSDRRFSKRSRTVVRPYQPE